MARVLPSAEAAQRALSFVGAPFLMGGGTRHGVDCVGLALLVYDLAPPPLLPKRRTLGPSLHLPWDDCLMAAGFAPLPDDTPAQEGALCIWDCGRGRQHLSILTKEGHVHAHALLRRVVLSPSLPDLALLSRWVRAL